MHELFVHCHQPDRFQQMRNVPSFPPKMKSVWVDQFNNPINLLPELWLDKDFEFDVKDAENIIRNFPIDLSEYEAASALVDFKNPKVLTSS